MHNYLVKMRNPNYRIMLNWILVNHNLFYFSSAILTFIHSEQTCIYSPEQ